MILLLSGAVEAQASWCRWVFDPQVLAAAVTRAASISSLLARIGKSLDSNLDQISHEAVGRPLSDTERHVFESLRKQIFIPAEQANSFTGIAQSVFKVADGVPMVVRTAFRQLLWVTRGVPAEADERELAVDFVRTFVETLAADQVSPGTVTDSPAVDGSPAISEADEWFGPSGS